MDMNGYNQGYEGSDRTESMFTPQGSLVENTFCTGCGTQIVKADSLFCENCGTPIPVQQYADPSDASFDETFLGRSVPDVLHSNKSPVSYDTPAQRTYNTPVQSAYDTPVQSAYDASPYAPYDSKQRSSYNDRQQNPPKSMVFKIAVFVICTVCSFLLATGIYFLIGYFNDTSTGDNDEGTPAVNGSSDGQDTDVPEIDADDIFIENVMLMDEYQAVQVLENQGFRVEVERASSNDVSDGLVISQSPQSGSILDPGNTVRIVVSQGPSVSSISIIYDGRPVTNLSIMIDETISLQVGIEPAGSRAEVEWSSSDASIFNVQPDETGSYAQITALHEGSATLTVTAEGLAQTCVINVSSALPSGTRLRQLYDEMEKPENGITLTFNWTSGDRAGRVTRLTREPGSAVWFMYGLQSDREVFPDFSHGNDPRSGGMAYIINWPRADNVTYYLFENGTGYFIDVSINRRWELNWAFSY